MKTYSQMVESSLMIEANMLLAEAMENSAKMDVLLRMLNEEVANTASAPGLATVSNGEPVSPRSALKMFRRKRRVDLP